MNLLAVGAAAWDGVVVKCTFAVEVDGAPVAALTSLLDVYELPDGAEKIVVTATPVDPHFFTERAEMFVDPDGEVHPTVDDTSKVNATAVAAAGMVVSRAILTVSRVRLATDSALFQLHRQPAKRQGKPEGKIEPVADFPPNEWTIPDRSDLHFIDVDQPVAGGKVRTVVRDIVGSDFDCYVVELAGPPNQVPRLLAVSWPVAVQPVDDADPTPFLVYYHPGTGQNVQNGYYTGDGQDPYPWNFDYCYFVMYAYQWYGIDPLIDPYPKGIPLQAAAAGKNLVSVIPCNAPTATEFGVFLDAGSVQAVLLEIQALRFREAGMSAPPATLGRTALAAFSSGNNFLTLLLGSAANRSHSFLTDVVKEMYFFEPPGYVAEGATRAALQWAGSDPERRIAVYTQDDGPAHDLLDSTHHAAPHVTLVSPTRTSSVLPIGAWRAARDPLLDKPDPTFGWQETHQIVSAMMLTHALATSGF